MRVGGQRHAPAALPPEKTRFPVYGSIVGSYGRSAWVRIRTPDRPSRGESLYRLSYPGPWLRKGITATHVNCEHGGS